jgi:cytochrome P450
LIVAGAETTATAATKVIWFLGENPDCHHQLKDEIRGVFTSPEQIPGDATAQLPYLNAVVEESLRIVPPVGFGLRHNSDSRKFDEADLFKPERWLERLPETESLRGFVFTLGPYGCLGITLAYLELRIAIAKLVFSLDWRLVNRKIYVVEDSEMHLFWFRPELRVRFSESKY